jgi:hypothetical protein
MGPAHSTNEAIDAIDYLDVFSSMPHVIDASEQCADMSSSALGLHNRLPLFLNRTHAPGNEKVSAMTRFAGVAAFAGWRCCS